MLLLDIDRFKTGQRLARPPGRRRAARGGRAPGRGREPRGLDGGAARRRRVRRPGRGAAVAPTTVHAVAARLLETLRRPYDLGPSAESLVATVSLGISVAHDATRSAGDLYREADLALYRAKDSGRDQYALFDDALRARADRRHDLGDGCSAARWTRTCWCPCSSRSSTWPPDRSASAEALARIQDGDRAGAAGRLHRRRGGDRPDRRGRRADVRAGRSPRVPGCSTPVRLAPPADHERVRPVAGGPAVRRAGRQGPDLVRRTRVDDPGRAHRAQPARDQPDGARVARPDPGARRARSAWTTSAPATPRWPTCSSFSLQFLKIDRSFVSRLGSSTRDDAVVSGGDRPGARARAGRHRRGRRDRRSSSPRCARMGCDRAQGYLMGRPMPASALDDLLRADPRW